MDVQEVIRGVGLNIRRIRQERNWTKKHLAGRLGYSEAYIDAVEQGEIELDSDDLSAFAWGLCCQVQELFKGM